jgi:hypothetical protein
MKSLCEHITSYSNKLHCILATECLNTDMYVIQQWRWHSRNVWWNTTSNFKAEEYKCRELDNFPYGIPRNCLLSFHYTDSYFSPLWTEFNRIIKIGLLGGCCRVVEHAAFRISCRRICMCWIPLLISGNVKHTRNAFTEYVAWSNRVQFMGNCITSRNKFPMHCRHVGNLAVRIDERNARPLHLIARAHKREKDLTTYAICIRNQTLARHF